MPTGMLRRAEFEGPGLLVRYAVFAAGVFGSSWFRRLDQVWNIENSLVVDMTSHSRNFEHTTSTLWDAEILQITLDYTLKMKAVCSPTIDAPAWLHRFTLHEPALCWPLAAGQKILGQSACSTVHSKCRGSRDVLSEALSCGLCGATDKCNGIRRKGDLSHKYEISASEHNAGLMLTSFTGHLREWCCVELFIVLRTQVLIMLCGTIHSSLNTHWWCCVELSIVLANTGTDDAVWNYT
jgi:hypothetical protein